VEASPANGLKRIRMATLIGVGAGLATYIRFVLVGMFFGNIRPDMEGFFVFEVVIGGVAIIVAFVVGWFFLYPLLRGVSLLLRKGFASQVPTAQWHAATDRGLWPLPFAAVLGAFAWVTYHNGYLASLHGWRRGVIFGILPYALGGWCYLSLMWSWGRVRRGVK